VDLSSELGFALAPRATDPTPAVTSLGPTLGLVTRSRAREGRSSVTQPELVCKPESNMTEKQIPTYL